MIVNATKNTNVPKVVGHAKVVKNAAWTPSFWNQQRIDNDPECITNERFQHWEIKEKGVDKPMQITGVEKPSDSSHGKRNKKRHPFPLAIFIIKRWHPSEACAQNTKQGRNTHVNGAGHVVAIQSAVFSGQDGSGNQ